MQSNKLKFILQLSILFAPPLAYGKTFRGAECTKDCSGHKAGYEWAQRKGINSPEKCGGSSRSFMEGCRIWATENQKPSDAHSEDK